MGSTITEKLLANASHVAEASAGDYLVADLDYVMVHDSTGPLAFQGVTEIGKGVFDKDRVILVFDHFYPAPSVDAASLHKISREFVKSEEISNFRSDGVCHQLLVEDYVSPGDIVVGADSHTCTQGALGAFSTGLGSTDAAGAIATGKCWFRVPESIKIEVSGSPGKGIYAKDMILTIIGELGSDGALYKAVEFGGDYVRDASVPSRITLCNMAVEMGAKNGVIEADDKTVSYLGREGKTFRSDRNAVYADEIEFDINNVEPQIACPSEVDNVVPVTEVDDVAIDQAYIGTCTNGRLEDLRVSADILKGNQVHPDVRLVVIPATTRIYLKAFNKGYIQTILQAGGVVPNPGCGPCIGRWGGVLADGETCITTQNRNFTGRMGHPSSKIYLASPATVAASALTGTIMDPRGFL
ncbi:MAG: 3-isopropylmalate dehydratase large subunit [Candidatus Bathyarchaeota archaeon]|jgi:homoaconitate hydratase family protein|nr:3-isopropylmalate dehydratase large subunit [Candidatus Bathyarchaeota archaeon]